METDLRVANKVIAPMGSLQPRISLLSLLPKGCPLIAIDFKDCSSLSLSCWGHWAARPAPTL